MPAVSHGEDLPVPPRIRRVLVLAAASLAVLTVLGMVALRARRPPSSQLREAAPSGRLVDARIELIEDRECPGEDAAVPELAVGQPPGAQGACRGAWVTVLEPPDDGQVVFVELPTGRTLSFSEGDGVVLNHYPEAEPEFQYTFADRQRRGVLWWLALGFAVVVVLLGRLRGLTALLGLAASLVVLVGFVLPAILDGRNPLLVAVVGAAAIAFLALYLAHGVRPMTTVALLGTLASLASTAALGLLVTRLAALSGYASEEATILQLSASRLDLQGLLLAGIVIGALGAIDDMTVTQVAAVVELRAANPELGRARLYQSALRIGRDHVASTVNTLALAYAAASIPLLLLFHLSENALADLANGELVATEIVRTLVGSIGLVASVPLTTWLAVAVLARPDPPAASSRNEA